MPLMGGGGGLAVREGDRMGDGYIQQGIIARLDDQPLHNNFIKKGPRSSKFTLQRTPFHWLVITKDLQEPLGVCFPF